MVPEPWHACAQIVEKGDPARFAAAMAAPVAARSVLFPLYALAVEVSRAPWVTEEAMIAEMRLQWWRDALEEIAVGGPVRRHEVTTPLAEIITPAQAQLLDEAVAARRWDIYRDPFEDADHFRNYITQTSSHVMRVGAQVLGDFADIEVSFLGYATGLARFFIGIPALEARGRVPLVDGRAEAVHALAQEALSGLDRFRRGKVARAAWPALIPAFEARTVLKQVVADPGAVSRGDLGLQGLRRSWALAQAARARF
ncbi:squalene/phytoene synthase family protein [Roseobacteraceae bacterium S113]